MEYKKIHTRFRAYQLGSKGSSFSYWDSDTDKFCLGEARYNDDNVASITHELGKCGKTSIDELYISSWDEDHCKAEELQVILKTHKPSKIYYPEHEPDLNKKNQVDSKNLIDKYNGPPIPSKSNGNGFPTAKPWTYSKVFYKQKLSGKANDDCLICLWRTGNFSVLSVGDLESSQLSVELAKSKILQETDVLLLSHHGSSPNFTTVDYLKAIKPRTCIALVDRENQYDHPNKTVYQRVNQNSWYYSTKDGDVIIESNGNEHQRFTVYNYISNGEKSESVKTFTSKKYMESLWEAMRYFGSLKK